MSNYCARTNVFEKIRQALEDLRRTQGMDVVFGDLETGKATVDIYDNGETVTIQKHMDQTCVATPTLNSIETPTPEPASVVQEIAPQQEENTTSKRSRKKISTEEAQ
jgi:hypothetical protein